MPLIIELVVFNSKDAQGSGFCIRDKRLGTQRTEFGVGKLGPHYTVPTQYRRMIYFDAALVTFIAEGRSDFIVFHFVMLVIGVAGANANFMYARKRLQVFTAQVDPLTFQIDDRHFAMPVFMFMIVVIVVIIMPPAMQTAAVRMTAFVDRKSTRLNSSHVRISYAVF